MIKKVILAIAFTLFIAGCAQNSQTRVQNSQKDSTYAIMEASGLNEQIKLTVNALDSIPQTLQMPKKESENMLLAIHNSFNANKIIKNIENQAKSDLDASDKQYLMSWYKSSIGKKITDAEIVATSKESLNYAQTNLNKLLEDTKRAELIEPIVSLTGSVKFSMKMLEDSQKMTLSILKKKFNFDDATLKDMSDKMALQLASARIEYSKIAKAQLIYTYRDIKQNDIKKYIEFLKSSAYQKFNKSFQDAIDISMRESIKRFIENL